MSNKVLITNSQKAVKVPSGLRILIRRACNAVLEYEHFDRPAEISVTFVDNAAIAELNNQYRNKPMPTDVLSFPLGENGKYDIDENNGCMMLGDIVISMEKKTENKEGGDKNDDKKTYLRREFSYSKFEQRFSLPENVEKSKITAGMADGVLTINIPKKTEEEKAKETLHIEIK